MKKSLLISDRFTSRAFFIQHLAAYEFVRQFVKDKVILDAGTRDGYGVYYLSEMARETIGIDIGILLRANFRNIFFPLLKKNGIFKKTPNKFSPIKMFYDNLINLNDFSYSSFNLNNSINLMGICRK